MQANNFLFEGKYTFDAYSAKLTAEAKNRASDLYSKKKKTNIFQMLCFPLFSFIKLYFFQLHIFRGKIGFIESYLKAFSSFNTYVFLWLLYRKLE